MLKLITLTLLIPFGTALAGEVVLHDGAFNRRFQDVHTRFEDGNINLKLTVERCLGSDDDICRDRIVFEKDFAVAGLKRDNDEMVLETETGRIVCGVFGTSRVLRVPVLRHTGDCQVSVKTKKVNGVKRLTVKLITR